MKIIFHKNKFRIFTFIIVLMLLVLGSSTQYSQAQSLGTCSLVGVRNLEATDTSCDNKDVTIGSGAIVTIFGHHNFNSLTITGNSTLTHQALTRSDYNNTTFVLNDSGKNKVVDITVAGTLSIASGSKIDVSGKGYLGTSESREDCWGDWPTNPCPRGDGPGGGVTLDRDVFTEKVPGGSGGGYGGMGGAGGDLYDDRDLYGTGITWNGGATYSTNLGNIMHGSGGGAGSLHTVGWGFNAAGGAGGGVVNITVGELINNGQIIANGANGAIRSNEYDPPIHGDEFWEYTMGGGGSGGLIKIVLNSDLVTSNYKVDVSGGIGSYYPGHIRLIHDRNGKTGHDGSAIVWDGLTTNVIAKGGNGGMLGAGFAAPRLALPPLSTETGDVYGSGGGGGRVNVELEPINELIAGLIANPFAGTVPPNLEVSLTGSEASIPPKPNPFDWQFSCNDSIEDNIIHGALLNSSNNTNSPYTPSGKCVYTAPGTYFPKVVLSKDEDNGGTYTTSFRVRTVAVVTAPPTPSPVTPTPSPVTPTPSPATPTPIPKPSVTFSASPTSINLGSSSTLSWTSTNATSLSIDHDIGSVTPIPKGTKIVSPTVTTTYTITANGSGGTATATATVTVVNNPNQGEISNIIIEKRMYKDDKGTEISTFEPGDKVVVTIRVNTNGQENLQGTLTDLRDANTELPTNITAGADKTKICGVDSGAKMLGGTFSPNNGSDNSTWRDISLPLGDSYICYTYYIKSDAAAKNIVSQANATLREKNTDLILGESSNVMMVRGYPFLNSEATPQALDTATPSVVSPVEDILSFSSTIAADDSQSGSAKSSASSVSYIYKRGIGAKSRGGVLLSLPVKMTDSSGNKDLAYGSYYLLYNPAFYLFGNVFSGNSSVGSSLDLGSRSNAITRNAFDSSNKLNSEASLYNYDFDKESVIFWDQDQRDKNIAMEKSISELISVPMPSIVCPNGSISKANLASENPLYLDNPDCNPIAGVASTWSNGRVWYMKANSDVEIKAAIKKKGTIIIDFTGSSNRTVKISTKSGSFSSDGSQLGLIVINGGNVQFTTTAQAYNGIIFVPGKSQGKCPSRTDGNINFEQGGSPIKIKGSIVADCINFASRSKDNGAKYAVTIYSDAKLLNSVLPGFENIMSVIYGK